MPQIKVRHFAGVSTEVGSLADSGDVISMPRSLAELTIDGDRWRDNTGTCWTVTQFTRVFESNNTWSWLCWVVDGCMALIEAFTSSRQPASRSLATEQSSAYTDACGDSGNVENCGIFRGRGDGATALWSDLDFLANFALFSSVVTCLCLQLGQIWYGTCRRMTL